MSSMVLLSWTCTEIWLLVLGYGACLGYERLVRRRIWRLDGLIYTPVNGLRLRAEQPCLCRVCISDDEHVLGL